MRKYKTAPAILRAAARYLEQHGWQQYGAGNDGGPRCVAGAIWSCSLKFCSTEAEDRFRGFIGGGVSIGAWNDAPGRTKEEAIATLHAAAGRKP